MPTSLVMLLAATSLALAAGRGAVAQPPAAPSAPDADSLAPAGARDPAYARDGRLALAVRGDLWVQDRAGAGARWVQVTSGPAWDREPAWSADGTTLVFASDRSGGFDLWRIPVGAAAGDPERLTSAAEPEGEPSVAADGRVVFVRGRGPTARLWLREPTGAERRLTRADVAERWPALSPDGERVAYVALGEQGRRLRVRTLASGHDTVIVGDRAAERPVWAPAGDRLAFTAGGGRGAVLVTPVDGAYVNLVAARHATPAWSPDGATLALAELPPGDVGYNGDPDRLGDREAGDLFARAGRLWLVAAPAAPPPLAPLAVPAVADRARHNGEAFDRVWSRSDRLYFADSSAGGATSAARRARWQALRATYRPRALAATTDDELEQVIHRMLRERPPLRESATGRAAVSSAHPVATEAGLEMLRRGGNVVDAAVAVSFALGVVEPDASGIGGYGQMLLLTTGMREPVVLEFMARVPEEATLANAALLRGGRLPEDGPVLAIVPGTVAAMHQAWTQHGKLPWAELLAPAIRAARDGYVVSEGLATTLATEREHFRKYEGSRKLFFPNGEPLRAGDTLRNPDLAWTLERIAAGGADAFYEGEVARRMVADLRGQGSPMTLADLGRYYAAERAPVATTYRGRTVYSSAPPVSGGATLAAQLNLLERFAAPRPYPDDAATLHAMASAWQLVPSTRGRIADPGLWPVTLAPFTSKDTAQARWRCFDPARALTAADVRGDSLPCAAPRPQPASAVPERRSRIGAAGADADSEAPRLAEHAECDPNDVLRERTTVCHSTGTTAFVVADAEGNVVSVTQTLGTWGGNFYVSPGLGFLYNDKLGSYGSEPDAYGARLPYARHGSTIAPTIVVTGEGARRRPLLALGAAGNAWITAAVYQTLTGMLDGRLDPQAALELPRFLPSGRAPGARGITLQIEDGLAPAVERRLETLGYRLQKISLRGELRMGYGAALLIGDRTVTAGADPRRSGAAGAVP